MDNLVVLWIISSLLVIAGLVGLVLPGLPGAPLIFAGLLLAAWAEGFEYVGLGTVLVLAVIALMTFAVDFWATMFGAKKFGASMRAVIGAVLGLIVGFFWAFPASSSARSSARSSANSRCSAISSRPPAPGSELPSVLCSEPL